MKLPDGIAALACRQYLQRVQGWLNDLALGGSATVSAELLDIPLGLPSETAALAALPQVERWAAAWARWQGPAEVAWTVRRWRALGAQKLPDRLLVRGPDQIAALGGMESDWALARARQAEMLARWPALAGYLGALYDDLLTSYPAADFRRMLGVLEWVLANEAAQCYPRELPVPGVDSKWLDDAERRRTLTALLRILQAGTQRGRDLPLDLDAASEFYARCGLRTPPRVLRIRVLDAGLRARVGGLGDISAPVDDLAALGLAPHQILVVENLQTGLALPDMPGTVAFLRLGYAVDALGQLPWAVGAARQMYWGDLDTHGFSILARARSHLPRLRSVLMDEPTLLEHRELWVSEPQPCARELAGLTVAEQAVYDGLRSAQWGPDVRLEQERVGWRWARARFDA